MSGPGPDIWLSGPGTSAATASSHVEETSRAASLVRAVLEVERIDPHVEAMVAAGWRREREPVSGPGGSQQLLSRGAVFVKVFAASD